MISSGTWLVSQCLAGTCVIWGILLIITNTKYMLFRQSFLKYHQSLFNSIWICVFPLFPYLPSFFPIFSFHLSVNLVISLKYAKNVFVLSISVLIYLVVILKFSLNSYFNSNCVIGSDHFIIWLSYWLNLFASVLLFGISI